MTRLSEEDQQEIQEKVKMVTQMAVRALVLPHKNTEAEKTNIAVMTLAISSAAGTLSIPDNQEAIHELVSLLISFSEKWAERNLAEIIKAQINEED